MHELKRRKKSRKVKEKPAGSAGEIQLNGGDGIIWPRPHNVSRQFTSYGLS